MHLSIIPRHCRFHVCLIPGSWFQYSSVDSELLHANPGSERDPIIYNFLPWGKHKREREEEDLRHFSLRIWIAHMPLALASLLQPWPGRCPTIWPTAVSTSRVACGLFHCAFPGTKDVAFHKLATYSHLPVNVFPHWSQCRNTEKDGCALKCRYQKYPTTDPRIKSTDYLRKNSKQ